MLHRRPVSPVLPSIDVSSKEPENPSVDHLSSSREKWCITWANFVLSALIPLMIGLFTIVSFLQQQKIDDRRRIEDQKLADWTRQQDQQQANELHYQSVYKSYIDDISNVLFKLERSNETFLTNETRLAYIRTKSLTALEELDWERRTRLFVFLYEQKLLPQSFVNESLDLEGAYLFNIALKSSRIKKCQFRKLSLPSVDLTNASFIECYFRDGVRFSGSLMTNAKFIGSRFLCSKSYINSDVPSRQAHVLFDAAALEQADFRDSWLCDVNFDATNLMYTNLKRATFQGKIELVGANLAYTNLHETAFNYPILVNVLNTNLTGAELISDQLNRIKERGDFKMTNVILPDGTWSINQINLVLNGNGEVNCSANTILHWIANNPQYFSYPTLRINPNSTCQYSFGFTVTNNDKTVSMYQDVDIKHFSLFIGSGLAEYKISADIENCKQGILTLITGFYDAVSTRVGFRSFNFTRITTTEKFQFNRWVNVATIPADTRRLRIQLARQEQGLCFVGNIELHIQRGS